MASIRIIQRKNKKRKDGTAPIALRISKEFCTHYIFLGQYILEKDWDDVKCRVRRTHPNWKKLNNFLMKKLVEANDLLMDKDRKLSSREIKNKLKGTSDQKSFFAFAAERIEGKYKQKVYSVARSELSILYNLLDFLYVESRTNGNVTVKAIKERRRDRLIKGRKYESSFIDSIDYFQNNYSLTFQEINKRFISKYKTFCSAYLNQRPRTITNQLIFIRTLFNAAIRSGVIEEKYYPFGGDQEKIRIGSGNKIGLTVDEVKSIEDLVLEEETSIWHTRNIWLLSFYFAGIRISDIVQLKWSDFKDNRLYYVMNKNDKPLSLKVPEKANPILSQYQKRQSINGDYVFPFLRDINSNDPEDIFLKTRNATKLMNKYLKRIAGLCGIDKNLSNHIARHSFGNIAGDRIHPLMLQKLYRHSDLKTTLNYQANFIHREADEALDSVVNFNTG